MNQSPRSIKRERERLLSQRSLSHADYWNDFPRNVKSENWADFHGKYHSDSSNSFSTDYMCSGRGAGGCGFESSHRLFDYLGSLVYGNVIALPLDDESLSQTSFSSLRSRRRRRFRQKGRNNSSISSLWKFCLSVCCFACSIFMGIITTRYFWYDHGEQTSYTPSEDGYHERKSIDLYMFLSYQWNPSANISATIAKATINSIYKNRSWPVQIETPLAAESRWYGLLLRNPNPLRHNR